MPELDIVVCCERTAFACLHAATGDMLDEWLMRLRREAADGFPQRVAAFRPEIAVHGKFRRPFPVCGTLLADRALSRLLKAHRPKRTDDS